MNSVSKTSSQWKTGSRALTLVGIMLIASLGPILSSPIASAHESVNSTIWPKQGIEDTGWVKLDATGADPINGKSAMADWMLNFAPGAIMGNISMEFMADGSDDIMVQEPLLLSPNTGQVLFDWRGNGWLGKTNGFDGSNPHQGRLSPNADVGATVTLPSGTEITDFILEALSPADPFTSLQPVDVFVSDYEIHPVDGRLYLAIETFVLVLDAKTSPHIIDLFEIQDLGDDNIIIDLEMDNLNDRLLVTTSNGKINSLDLNSSAWVENLPDEPSGEPWTLTHITSNGDLYAFSESGIFTINSANSGWTLEASSSTNNWPEGTPTESIEHSGIIYTALSGGGVGRWDLVSMSALSPWSTANNLHSDFVTNLIVAGNQLMISSSDAGIARRDLTSNFWLATWNDGNWLSSNDVKGMAHTGNELQILTDSSIHVYNSNSGIFTSEIDITTLGLYNGGKTMFYWPSSGARSPLNDTVLVSDGSAVFAKLEPGNSPMYAGDLVVGSGPSSEEINDVMQFNGILYSGSGSMLDRYSLSQARWLPPVDMGDSITRILHNGSDVFVSTDGNGIHAVDPLGNIVNSWGVSDGLQSDDISDFAADGNLLVVIHPNQGASFVNISSQTTIILDEDNSDLSSDQITGVTIHNGIAYFGTNEDGLNRYILENDTWLGSWVSTGINDVDFAPVAVYGTNPQILHMGLPGYGVARKDLSTGEILIPLTVTPDRGSPSSTEILPSNQVYALEENTILGGLYIGTGDGAVVWNGNSATELSIGGSWNLRPDQHFDFIFEGSTTYSATNIGVCKYVQTSIQECVNAQDGMPNWGVYAIGMNSTTIFGGTTNGVGLIDKTSFNVVDTWEAGEDTDNAVIEVIDDIAYIGLSGLGIARYDITNNIWLPTWTEDNVLDDGNEFVSGLVADINPNRIWIGGEDGFQLIDVTTGSEVYDIELTGNMYPGSGEPYDLTIYGDTMYYHQQYSSDNVFRLDIVNFSTKSSLDVGAQLDENGGDIYGLEIIDNLLHVSVASGQWWNTQGSGGIAIYNLTSDSWQAELLPSGSLDRVTSHISSNGIEWIVWGEERLEAYYPNGTKMGEWEDVEFPIREIVEFDGETLFATEDGIARFDETSEQWLSTWTPGSGLPNSANDAVYEMWTNGSDLVVGTASSGGWQGLDGEIMHLDPSGVWTSWDTGQNGIPNGYPIGMAMCGDLLHVSINANNGGVARFDLENGIAESSFTTSTRLDDGNAAAVACDDFNNILYVGYSDDSEPISRYDYNNDQWLTSLTSSSHNIPSDPVWWGAMEFANGKLAVGYDIGDEGDNIIGGGYVLLSANGATVGSASILSQGAPVTSIDWLGTQWLIGQAGGTSGYSHVDTLGQSGQNTVHALPSLVSGQVTSMAGNSTHLWAASASWQNTGSGVLQGIRLADGSVEWQKGWSIPSNAIVTDIKLAGDDLYLSSNNRGLRLLDTVNGNLVTLPTGIHDSQDGLKLVGDDLYIGLQGTGSSSAGIQIFNTTTNTYTAGRLLAGLPSNNVNAFLTTSSSNGAQEIVYIATDNGVARWNSTANSWETALTALDGLPISYVQNLLEFNNNIWMTTPSGLSEFNSSSDSFTNYGTSNGLMGTSAWGLVGKTTSGSSSSSTVSENSLFISHDGKGTDRPGITQLNVANMSVISQHQFDQLPSNAVTAVTSDIGGIHISTTIGPIIHWTASNGLFNSGVNIFSMQDWPVYRMRSDGSYLIATGNSGATVLHASTNGNAVHDLYPAFGATGGSVVSNSLVAVSTSSGMRVWDFTTGEEMDSTTLRRAAPLSLGLQLEFEDITDYTHPDQQFALVNENNTVKLGQGGVSDSHGIIMQTVPLTLSSPVDNAATWLKLVEMKWNATVNMSNDPTFASSMQYVVDNGILLNGTRHVNLKLSSPSNGSLMARLSYDWYRTETPVEGISLWDRPDDGGSALMANWTMVHDDDFARYLIYLNEGQWTTPPTTADLQSRNPDASVSLHSRLQSEVTSISGLQIQDGIEYWAIVVVEYNDGRLGTPSSQFGPAISTDEIPIPPKWVTAKSGSQFVAQDGEVLAEWSRCSALDLMSTRVYASTTEISDALGMSVHTEILPQSGNTSVLTLEAGKPHWLALTCVDIAGQEDLANAIVIGPVVPTGGIDDGVPPPKLQGVWAEDVPNDDGGRVQIGWENSIASDCAYVVVYMTPVDTDENSLPPSSVDGMTEAVVVPDCETNTTIVDSIGDDSLIDGQSYWIGAVAFDKWLNGDLGDVTILEVTPYVNNNQGASIPDRISQLTAWDYPNDDGTAIEISWDPSQIDDFDYYVIWTSQFPLSDLTELWEIGGTEPGICGCIVMNKQWIDTEKSPLELTINTALYGSDTLLTSIPRQIIPDVELHVTVTVHDINGNVYLDSLNTATVTPIDNLEDNIPPNRLTNLNLYDRPKDDGTAVMLEFSLSESSDISHYDIYAASFEFTSVGPTGIVKSPIATLDRLPELPLTIEMLDRQIPVLPGTPVTVAVVPVDWSGNAYLDSLVVSTTIAEDNDVESLGEDLPEIDGINLQWVDDSILVTWNPTDYLDFSSYSIYISSIEFNKINDATNVGNVNEDSGNSFLITNDNFPSLSNEQSWWVGISLVDEFSITKEKIDSVKIDPAGSSGNTEDGDKGSSSTNLSDLLTTENILLAGLVLISLILLLLVVRGRGSKSSRNSEWELQEATWGIQSGDGWDSPGSFATQAKAPASPPPTMMRKQQPIIHQTADKNIQQDIQQPQRWSQPNKEPEVDTSFLDDLL